MLKLSVLENLPRILEIFILGPCWSPSPGETQTNIPSGKPVLSALRVVMAVISNGLLTAVLGLAKTFIRSPSANHHRVVGGGFQTRPYRFSTPLSRRGSCLARRHDLVRKAARELRHVIEFERV